MRRPREHQGRKYGVKLWIPPERLADIAADRTSGMLAYFLHNGSSDPLESHRQLRSLVQAAYMQGLNDMADAIAKSQERQA